MDLQLSLVIPAFNEADRLAVGFERLQPVLATWEPSSYEIIVIDDGSSDATMQKAREVYGHFEHARFVQHSVNLGKGAALRLGMSLAHGAHVLTMDADMAIDPGQLTLFVTALQDSALVPGSRAIKGRIRYNSLVRTYAGSAYNRVVRFYTKTPLRDTQCGCKGFQLGAARVLALLAHVDGFAFDVETLYLADQLALGVRPLLVTWRDVGGSSVRPGRDAWSMIRDIRTVTKTTYENPVVEIPRDVDVAVETIAALARDARLHGLVIARGEGPDLVVLPREGALGGATVAHALGGQLRTAGLEELRGRSFEAI